MWRKFILLTISLLIVQAGWGQKLKTKDVPPRIITTLDKQFKGNKRASWEKADSLYIVNFEYDDQKGMAIFHEKGRMISSEVSVNNEELPFSVNHYLRKNYPDDVSDSIIKARDATKAITYRIIIAGDRLEFDNEGRFLSKEKVQDDLNEINMESNHSEK